MTRFYFIASCIALAVSSGHSQQAATETSKASTLVHQCELYIRGVTGGPVEISDAGDAFHCTGYIDGFEDGYVQFGSGLNIPATNVGTQVRVFLAYMAKNPKLLDLDKGYALKLALQDAYGGAAGR